MAENATAVTLEQYLFTSYCPDVEFVHGELREKSVVSPVHGRVQILLGVWFGQYEEQWGVQTLAKARTQVSEHAVRLPDVTVMAAGPLPRKALVRPPLLAIEVLSESDSYADLNARALDLEAMGVENIWLIDPGSRTAERWAGGAWQAVEGTSLAIAGSPVYLDLSWLWARLGPQS
jgi:Uma2 family endonuclease